MQDVVLGMVAEGLEYGYEIARELEDDWTSAAIYRALGRLRDRGLIERADGEDPHSRSKRYKLTSAGAELNEARLVRLLGSRHDALSTVLRAPSDTIATVLDEHEARLLKEVAAEPVDHVDVVSELAWTERRLVSEARLRWISIVRAKVGDVAPRT